MFDGVHFYYTFGLLPYQLICQLSLAILHKIKVESDQVDNEERASYKALRHFLEQSRTFTQRSYKVYYFSVRLITNLEKLCGGSR